jgi:hypothetical protein
MDLFEHQGKQQFGAAGIAVLDRPGGASGLAHATPEE